MESIGDGGGTSIRNKRGLREVAGRLRDGKLGRWAPIAMWMALIFFLSSQSTLPLPGVDWLDELIRIVGHFTEYAVLGFLVSRAVATDAAWSIRRMGSVLIVCGFYALSDEWHQSSVPGRDASLFDFVVDSLGATVGCLVYRRRMKDAG